MTTHQHALTTAYQEMHPDRPLSAIANALINLAADVDRLNTEAAKPAATSTINVVIDGPEAVRAVTDAIRKGEQA